MAQSQNPSNAPKTSTPSTSSINAMELFSKLDPMAENFEEALKEAERAILESTKTWVRQQVGFPPYWAPTRPGALFLGRIVALDARQEDFQRYIVQATKFPMYCRLGPTDDAEKLMVPPGDFFTVSNYASLALEEFIDIEVLVAAVKKRKLPGNEESGNVKRDLWMWEVKVPSETEKKMIDTRRSEKAKELMAARELTDANV